MQKVAVRISGRRQMKHAASIKMSLMSVTGADPRCVMEPNLLNQRHPAPPARACLRTKHVKEWSVDRLGLQRVSTKCEMRVGIRSEELSRNLLKTAWPDLEPTHLHTLECLCGIWKCRAAAARTTDWEASLFSIKRRLRCLF